jgi:hypothetical protein
MNKSRAVLYIKSKIALQGMTHGDFAKKAGVSEAFLSQQFNNDQPLSQTILDAAGLVREKQYDYKRAK